MKFNCPAKFEEYLKRVIYPVKIAMQDVIVGQYDAVDSVLLGLISVSQRDISSTGERHLGCGHCLLEGATGKGKTIIAKVLSALLAGTNRRISGLPDIQPSDITGGEIFLLDSSRQVIHGPIKNANLIIIDEINRFSPKCQAAFIEMLAEGSITIGDITYHLKSPFMAIGTLNPSENSRGMSKIAEALADRMLFKVLMADTSISDKVEVAKRTHKFDIHSLKQITTLDEINDARIYFFDNTYVDDKIRFYIARLLDAINESEKNGLYEQERAMLEHTPIFRQSPPANERCMIHLESAAMANAAFSARDFVVPRDVIAVAHRVLRGRLLLNPSAIPTLFDINPGMHTESHIIDNLITQALDAVHI